MYAEVERLIKDTLNLEDDTIYEVTYSDEDGEVGLHQVVPLDLIRDLLLDYYYKGTEYAFVSRVLVQNCKLDPLDAIELIGAIDALKEKNKTNLS